MTDFRKLYAAGLSRYGGGLRRGEHIERFHYYFRKLQTESNKLLILYYRYQFRRIKQKLHIEIYYKTEIGKGLYIGHPYCITVNPKAKIGSNVNLHKGITIGQENRGSRQGVPTIGNNVWIGVNATVVGNISVGNDVLIAPNSFVNCDVPDHSIVFGNPCIIKNRENATEGYINNRV